MSSLLTFVRTVSSALAGAHTEAEVAQAVLTTVADHVGATTASLWLVTADETEMVLAYERNAAADAVARFGRIPMDSGMPGPSVVLTRQPAFVSSRAERDERWPDVAGTPTVAEAIVVLPLVASDSALGVVSFGFAEVRSFDAEDEMTLMAIADQCAVAMDRARLFQALQADADANDLLARVSAAGGGSDWQTAAQTIVQLCIDALVDTCVIYVVEGSMVRRVAAASRHHSDVFAELVDRFPTPISASVAHAVAIRSGEPFRIRRSDITFAEQTSPSPEYQRIVRGLSLGDGWVLPLQDGGRTFGAMLFAVDREGAEIPDAVLDLARHVATRAATVLRSAEEFSHYREALDAIHAVLLPGDIPQIEGVDVAACYQPVASRPNVGGDWWDVVTLPDGRVAFSIGDVAGHGIAPVGLMGQLRTAARSHLVTGCTPCETLTAMSSLLDWTAPTAHATAAILIMDLAANTLLSSVAGHPPPLILGVDGEVRLVASPPAPPLGVPPKRAAYVDQTSEIEPGATLVLYTDGLIEDRNRALDDGLSQLIDVLRSPSGETLETQCDRVVARLVEAPEDDVCLLMARRRGEVAELELGGGATVAQEARRFVRAALEAWGLRPMVSDTELVTSELVTNAVLYGDSRATLRLERRPGGIRLEVTDFSGGVPELQPKSLDRVRGRGLQIVDAVASSWGVDTFAGGKTVWAEIG